IAEGDTIGFPFYDVRIDETENHRLMIETSRFLTNAAIIRHLEEVGYKKSLIDDIRDYNNEIRDWLLDDLKRITGTDFDEYNTRLSLESILNLFEFSGDKDLCAASAIVLNLSDAKFVAGSDRGRRAPPYRRLREHDGSGGDSVNLYNIVNGADHEVVRFLVLG